MIEFKARGQVEGDGPYSFYNFWGVTLFEVRIALALVGGVALMIAGLVAFTN